MTSLDPFAEFVKKECAYYGVKCSLRDTKYVIAEKSRVDGFFDATTKTLVCAMKNERAIETLAHEYCHLTQWAEKAPVWVIVEEMKSYDVFYKYFSGEAVNDIELHITLIRNLELDNERRTVEIIKKFELPVDIDRYIQHANAYLMFYNWLKAGGHWVTGKKPGFKCEKLIDSVPKTLSMNYEKLPKKLEKIFIQEGYNRKK